MPGIVDFYFIAQSDTKENLEKVAKLWLEIEDAGLANEIGNSDYPLFRTMPASSPPPHKPHPTSGPRAGSDSLGPAFASQFVALLDRQLAASHTYIEPEVACRAPAITASASRTDLPEAQKSALFATSEGENYRVFPSDSYRDRARKPRTFAIESQCSHEYQ